MKAGDRVVIRGEHAGSVPGTVLDVWTTDHLPDLPHSEEFMRQVRTILAEWDVREIWWIQHAHGPYELYFAALVTSNGETRDLHGQRLTVAPIHGEIPTK